MKKMQSKTDLQKGEQIETWPSVPRRVELTDWGRKLRVIFIPRTALGKSIFKLLLFVLSNNKVESWGMIGATRWIYCNTLF